MRWSFGVRRSAPTKYGLNDMTSPHRIRATCGRPIFGTRASIWIGRLSENDIADVDRDHQHVRDRPAIRAACIGTALRRESNSVRNGIVRCKLRRFEASGDIDTVVVAPQFEIRIKEELLNKAVSFD